MGGMDLGRRFRKRKRDALVLGDGAAERDAMLRVLDRALERPAGETDGAGGVVHAAEGYTEKRDAKPVMKRADELPGFDANAVEARLALAASDLPVHSDHPLQPEALGVGGNQKGADAAPSGGGA